MANPCCNNPTLAYRSEHDRAMNKEYCSYALKAPTDFYKDYAGKEFFSGPGCGDSMPQGYSSLGSAYGPKPGSYAKCTKEDFLPGTLDLLAPSFSSPVRLPSPDALLPL